MNALTEAYNAAERMHATAVANVKQAAASLPSIIAGGGDGIIGAEYRKLNGNAAEQLRHFWGTVFTAIRPIAQRIAGQTIHVGRVTRQRMRGSRTAQLAERLPLNFKSMGDQIEPLVSHPILELLHDPNQLMVAWSLIYTTVASLELTGRAFWHIARDRSEILPIPSSWIKDSDGTTRYETWYVQPPGVVEPIAVPADEMVYIHYPHPGNPRGVFSPLQAAALAVETDEAIGKSQLLGFRQGFRPKVVIKAGRVEDPRGGPALRPVLTKEQRTQLIEAIRNAYSGFENWNEPVILDGLIEGVDVLGRSVAEMDFQNSAKMTESRIFKAFGVNPIVVGQIEGANRAQASVAEQNFCDQTVNPKIELISQALTEFMAPMFARGNERLVIWIERCRARDPELHTRQINYGASKGLMTINEWRREMNLPDMPWGEERLPAGQLPPPSGGEQSESDAAKSLIIDPYSLKRLTAPPPANGKPHERTRV